MKTIRYLDAQGRVILPSHIRKALNLKAGSAMQISLEDDTIRINPTEERCVICGSPIKEEPIKISDKLICDECASKISQERSFAWEKHL